MAPSIRSLFLSCDDGQERWASMRLVRPWLNVFFLWSLIVVAWLTGLPEEYAAGGAILWFVVIASLHPVNGLFFILLVFPFFLGEYGWPYMWLIELFAAGTVLSWGIHGLVGRGAFAVPSWRWAILFLFAAMASVPLDARQLPYELWSAPWSEVFSWWVVGHTGPITYYFRILFNLVTAVGLYGLAATFMARGGAPLLLHQLRAMVAMAGLVGVAGIVMWAVPLRGADDIWRYASVSLVGEFGGSITAFAFALHFFQQYLILTFPVAVTLLFLDRRRYGWLVVELTASSIIVFCVLQGSLRTSTALIYLTLLIAAGALGVRFLKSRNRFRITTAMIGGGVAAVVVGGYLLTFTGAYHRLAHDFGGAHAGLWENIGDYADDPLYFMKHDISEPRFMLWHTAVKMFADSPLLGVGLGRFSPLFIPYFGPERYSWNLVGYASGATSHSLYFEMLANQGLFGLGLFFLFIGSVVMAGVRSVRSGEEPRSVLALMGLGVVALWLLMGVTHYIPLCRPVELYFYVVLGVVAGLGGASEKGVAKTPWLIGAALIVAAGVWQVAQASGRPLAVAFSPGFYHWEKQPDGSYRRWMGSRGVYVAKVVDGKVTVGLAAPLPGLDKRPQKVIVAVEGTSRATTLTSADLVELTIPIDESDGALVPVKVEADWVYNPKEAGANDDDRNLGVMLRYEEAD